MTGPSNSDRARHAGLAMDAFMSADGRTGLNAHEALTALLASLRHYADPLGADFGEALRKSSDAYARQRDEEHPYAVGQEIRLRTRRVLTPSLASLPGRGVVEALYPGVSGTRMYAVRFPGEVSAMPFIGEEIEPAPAFPPVRTSRGAAVTSLVHAEQLLAEAATRIRDRRLRKLPADKADIADRQRLSAVLGEICDLTPQEIWPSSSTSSRSGQTPVPPLSSPPVTSLATWRIRGNRGAGQRSGCRQPAAGHIDRRPAAHPAKASPVTASARKGTASRGNSR